MTIETEKQKLDQDAKVYLYRLDLSEFGEGFALFSPNVLPDGSPVSFGGETYTTVPVKSEGFSWSGDGDTNSPRLRLPRRNPAMISLLNQYDQLRGVPVRRIVTYRQHLDDGADPDGNAVFSNEVYVVEKTDRPLDSDELIFELSSPLDQAEVMVPRRLVTREFCGFTYRIFDPTANNGQGAFDYSRTFCPYTGGAMFDENGKPVTDPALDSCSRQLANGCEVRHPSPAKVPFGGFPGAARVRN